MQRERFEEFSCLVTGIYRDIQKLKARRTEELGLKQVHIFWVYLLLNHEEGLTASELASYSESTRALVSREIDALSEGGYVTSLEKAGKRRYAAKFVLTEKGRAIAEQISKIALDVQNRADDGIPSEDLIIFYRTLKKLRTNFEQLTKGV